MLFYNRAAPISRVYIDGIVFRSSFVKEHAEHHFSVLQLPPREKLHAKRKKCTFEAQKIECCEFLFNADGNRSQWEKLEDIAKWLTPQSNKDVRALVGIAGFYSTHGGRIVVNNPDDDIRYYQRCHRFTRGLAALRDVGTVHALNYANPRTSSVLGSIRSRRMVAGAGRPTIPGACLRSQHVHHGHISCPVAIQQRLIRP